VASAIAGPLQGIPAISEALQSAIAVETGGWDNSGNLLSGLGKYCNLAGKLNFGGGGRLVWKSLYRGDGITISLLSQVVYLPLSQIFKY
jgi:hypothetical protein